MKFDETDEYHHQHALLLRSPIPGLVVAVDEYDNFHEAKQKMDNNDSIKSHYGPNQSNPRSTPQYSVSTGTTVVNMESQES
jgi:hypothetical protein